MAANPTRIIANKFVELIRIEHMITVQEAEKIILDSVNPRAPVSVPLKEAFGRILREDLVADRDLPPFNRVAMDGIAIHYAAWQEGCRRFPIEDTQKAGSPQLALRDGSACLEVMTGAVLPKGCDGVVPVENIEVKDGAACLREGFQLVPMQNVHLQGSDYKKGSVLLEKGCRLLSVQVAVAASIGKDRVMVSQTPKVAVVGTGDELVEINQPARPFQIRQSNSYAIQSALEFRGYDRTERFHVHDDKDEITRLLTRILREFDIAVLSGGVSMGKFDYIPEVLKELKVDVLFHKVKQRPGRPFWFGKSKEGQPVFALPGNPVSTQTCLYRYVLPYMEKAAGLISLPEEYALLDDEVNIKTPLTYFLPVKVIPAGEGYLRVVPVYPNGSGDYASLAKSDGFVELEAEMYHFRKGAPARLYRWGR